jgi:REP element-mobilizing transposase RayT
MNSRDISYHRNLPHIHPDGYPLFITFRLADSLPRNVLEELKLQRDTEIKALKRTAVDTRSALEQEHFENYDNRLDRCEFGPRWLQNESAASIVAAEMHAIANERYHLLAYSIMPNHVHMIIQSLIREGMLHGGRTANYPVADTLRLLKGRTARYCNLALRRHGAFWQHESYDHVVHEEQELEKTILYILNNPVKAGLAQEWKDWKFTYVSPELGEW